MSIRATDLPEWMRPFAEAIDVRPARNPGFWVERVHTGVELVLDVRSPLLPEDLAAPLRARYGDGSLRILEDAPRSQHINLGSAIAKLEALLLIVAAEARDH